MIYLEYMPGVSFIQIFKVLYTSILNFFINLIKGSLKNKISRNGPMNEKTVKKYTKQILEGLDYLHTNRFIHRDVKSKKLNVKI